MVLGLLDFLLGGKKKTKVSRSGQVVTPMNQVGGVNNVDQQQQQNGQLPDGQQNPTQNIQQQNVAQPQNVQQGTLQPQQQSFQDNQARKSSISEALMKIHTELKESNLRITEVVGDVKKIENTVNTLGHRIDELDEGKKVTDEKLSEIDANMSKFLSLYELVNNQYNPFVENDGKTNQAVKQVVLANGQTETGGLDFGIDSGENAQVELARKLDVVGSNESNSSREGGLESSLLELDTLDIEEAAGDAVPLTRLKNNTNSLVIILSWLEYLIKKVGIEETRNTLRYYTEVLRWTTPEVYFDLDKYLRGMKDKKEVKGDESLTVRDHIVSLYFISKLNEKTLDKKLTSAVLQIIKE